MKTSFHVRHSFAIWQSAVLSIAITVVMNTILLMVIRHIVTPFGPLNYQSVALYTLYGAIVGAVGYALLRMVTTKVDRVFLLLSLLVLVVSLYPDLGFFRQPMMHMVMNGMGPARHAMPNRSAAGRAPMMGVGAGMFRRPTKPAIFALMFLHLSATAALVWSLTGLTKRQRAKEVA